MGRVISLFNQKGGVAKTTTTINLGWALINKKKKVLMIDTDSQGHLSKAMQIDPEVMKYKLHDALHGINIERCMLTDQEYFYFIPCDINLAAAEEDFRNRPLTLQKLINPIRDKFDFILIDCPPSLGSMSINSLCASDSVIVPMQTDYLAWDGFELFMDTFYRVRKLNPNLDLMGILATLHENTNHNKQILELINSTGKAFKTVIPKSVKFKDAIVMGEPIVDYDKKLGQLFLEFADEVIGRG